MWRVENASKGVPQAVARPAIPLPKQVAGLGGGIHHVLAGILVVPVLDALEVFEDQTYCWSPGPSVNMVRHVAV